MTKFYEINENIGKLLEEYEEILELDNPEERLGDWQAEFLEAKEEQADKLEAIMIVIQEANLRAKSIGSEIDRLEKLQKQEEKTAERLLHILDFFMRNDNRTELKTNKFTAKYKKNPAKMEISDEMITKLMGKFKIPEAEASLKEKKSKLSEYKKKVKNDLKNGKTYNGFILTQGVKLVIK